MILHDKLNELIILFIEDETLKLFKILINNFTAITLEVKLI